MRNAEKFTIYTVAFFIYICYNRFENTNIKLNNMEEENNGKS